MDRKLVITRVPDYPNITFCALYDGSVLLRLFPIRKEEGSRLQNIYVGKVHSVAKNLNAAFIDIGEDELYFLNIDDAKKIVFTSEHKGKIKPGDEFLVQVDKEATKQKNPIVKTEICLTGKYCVVFSGEGPVHYSAKLTGHQKTRIEKAIGDREFSFEVTVRTNAGISEDYPAIIKEIEDLCEKMSALIKKSAFLKAKSLIYSPPQGIAKVVANLYDNLFDEIVTDIEDIYNNKESLLGEHSAITRKYDDKLLPLYKLFRLEKNIQEALSRKIYLKSGGFLIWEDTEALTAIDVNSGQFTKGHDREKTFMKVNLEAAEEIARQIQLRNTSGIIIVDLINMRSEEDKSIVLEAYKKAMSHIYNTPHVIDITRLGLLEITRKKQEKTLKQLLTD